MVDMNDRNPLKQKHPRPTEESLPGILGPERLEIVRRVRDELQRRRISVALGWGGPQTGWGYVAMYGAVPLCALALASEPIIGVAGISRKVENAIVGDSRFSDAGMAILESTHRRGTLRWVQVELRSRDEVDAFVDIVCAKKRALVAAAPPTPTRRALAPHAKALRRPTARAPARKRPASNTKSRSRSSTRPAPKAKRRR